MFFVASSPDHASEREPERIILGVFEHRKRSEDASAGRAAEKHQSPSLNADYLRIWRSPHAGELARDSVVLGTPANPRAAGRKRLSPATFRLQMKAAPAVQLGVAFPPKTTCAARSPLWGFRWPLPAK